MFWYITLPAFCLLLGIFIGKLWERKKIFKKIIPEDIWRFQIRGAQSTHLCRGTLTVYFSGKRITKIEFHQA